MFKNLFIHEGITSTRFTSINSLIVADNDYFSLRYILLFQLFKLFKLKVTE